VRAGLVKRPEEWKWSSYRATAGEEPRPSFLMVDWILSQLWLIQLKYFDSIIVQEK